MRTGLLSDIHGNREAFEACLDHAERHGIDRYVFLGDYVGYGADPGWVLDTVMTHCERGALAVLGNHDAAVLNGTEGMNEAAAAAIAWTRPQLTATQRAFLKSLPLTAEERGLLYVHASADAPNQWNYVTGLQAAARSLQATSARITFCGHTHVPALFHMPLAGKSVTYEPVGHTGIALTQPRRWLAVIGSVGQPRDGNPAACYAIFDDRRDTLTYIRVPYDIDRAARKIRDAGLPPLLSTRLYEGY